MGGFEAWQADVRPYGRNLRAGPSRLSASKMPALPSDDPADMGRSPSERRGKQCCAPTHGKFQRRMRGLFLGGGGGFGHAGCDNGIQERHHGAKLGAKLLDDMLLFGFALGEEVGAALFVFFNPSFGEAAIAN